MKFIDAYILASTKRKTRRIRTALVVIVSSLLFAVLFGVALAAQGLIEAGKQVGNVGFNARNLTYVTPLSYDQFDYNERSKAIETSMVAELKARKVKVTDQTKQDPSYMMELNRRLSLELAKSQEATIIKAGDRIKELGNPSAIYHFSPLPVDQFAKYQTDLNIDPFLEELKKQQKSGGDLNAKSAEEQFATRLDFYSAEADMFMTQLAPGQTFAWQPGQPYPLIISYGYLEKLSGKSLTKLDAKKRNEGYRDLIKQFAGKELNYCYRNTTAQDQLRAVLQYNLTAETDKDSSTKPIEVQNCTGFDQKLLKKLEIISDTDPTGVKPLFPPPVVPAPETTHKTFKIVGFTPANQEFGATDVITSMLTGISSLPAGPNPGIVPLEVVKADPLLKGIVDATGGMSYSNLFADFKTRQEQKDFIAKSCSGSECSKGGELFMTSFGNIAAALEGFFGFISKALLIAAGIIMVIAALMIMLTISKVIADSTKEIAVFRSLGARRRDIAQIYYTYGLMLAISSLIIAVVLAIIGAMVLSSMYDEKIAQGLIQAAGAYSTNVKVTLLGVNPKWLGGITLALFVAALVGITIPILISMRRKLITILREE